MAHEAVPECDIPVRNTFIHFDDHFDEEDTLPVFYQRTRSGPAGLQSMRGAFSASSGDESESATVADSVEDVKALESSWATHKLGKCVPCAYFILKAGGCRKGSQCDRCHFCNKKDLQQWKRTAKKAKGESRKIAREAREIADVAPPAEVAPEAQDTLPGRLDGDDDSTDDVSRYQRPFVVKNTFIHFSDDEEDEGSLSVRVCKSEFSPYRERRAFQLEACRARLSDLLSESASLDGKKKQRASGGSGSYHSSCSTSPGPSPGRLSRWHSTAASSSDPTEVREPLEEVEALDGAGTPTTSLETRGTSFETHQAGECQPCFYFNFKADGCRRGADCIYCHFCSSQDSKRRKRTAKTLAKQLKRAYEAKCC